MKNRETSISSARITGRSLLLGVLPIPVNVYRMTLVEVKYCSLLPQFTAIRYIKRIAVFQNSFTDRPWSAIRGTRISVYPFAVGLAFFLPLNLSFSCWFFFVVRLAEFVIAAALGTRYFPAEKET